MGGGTIDSALGVRGVQLDPGERFVPERRIEADRWEGENGRGSPIANAGKTAGAMSTVEILEKQQLADRDRKLHDRLVRFARGFSRDWDVTMVPGKTMAYDPAKKKLSYPIERMRDQSDTQNLADVINALAPARYSLVPSAKELESNPAFGLLWKGLDTIRVRNIIAERYPNVSKMLRTRNEDLTQTSQAGLKSKEFIDTLLSSWATGRQPDPERLDPSVREALDRTRTAIEEATRVPPKLELRFEDMDAATVKHEAERAYHIIRDHVWPAVEWLLHEDLEQNDNPSADDNASESSSQAEGKTGAPDDKGKPGETDKTEGEHQESTEPQEKSEEQGDAKADGKGDAKGEAQGEAQGADRRDGEGEQDRANQQDGANQLPQDPLAAGNEGEAKERAKADVREQLKQAMQALDGPEKVSMPEPEKKGDEPAPKPAGAGEPSAQPAGTQPQGGTTSPKRASTKSTGATTSALSASGESTRSWTQIKSENHRVIRDMTVRFATHFLRSGIPEMVGHFSEGEVWDMQRGLENKWRAEKTGEAKDDREYLQEEDPIESYDEVILVVDTSRSMADGGKHKAAQDALVAFHETFESLGVRHAIIEFAGTPTTLLEMGEKPTAKKKDEILRGLSLKDTGTDDYSALLHAKTKFSPRATRKLIVFITDGQGSKLQRRAVERAEDGEQIKVLGLHIGGGDNSVAESYRHGLSQPNVRRVPVTMSEFLLDNW